jgi:hypothetical protein
MICIMLLTMNYVWLALLLLAIVLVRIDYIAGLFDRAYERMSNRAEVEISTDVKKARLIPLRDDRNLKTSARTLFFALLDEFRLAPSAELRNRAISEIRKEPDLFGPALDSALEGRLYQLRDRLQQKHPESIMLMTDLMNVLKGENQLMVRRLYSLVLDSALVSFFTYYPKALDPECRVAAVTADRIEGEVLINELETRERKLAALLRAEKVDPEVRAYAENCRQVVRIVLARLQAELPQPQPAAEASGESAEGSE